MKALIIAFNRLTMLRNLADELNKAGLEVVIIDNNSTYPPLLEWYSETKYEVVRLNYNGGHQILWNDLSYLITEKYYIVTDHDLDISGLPADWVDVLRSGLDLFPNVIKSGLSLKIDDLPENEYTKEVIKWESKYWQRELKNGFYLSEIDTTLAMYDKTRNFGKLPNDRFFSAVRSDNPYTAVHVPWYLTKESLADDEEEQYYQNSVTTYWSGKFKELI